MIGTKFYKGQFTDMQYAKCAEWCNENNATIEDKGEYYECVAIPAPSFDELKAQKLAELKTIRDTEEVKPIAYNGNLFDFDDKARERMRIAQQSLEDNNIESQLWTCADNVQVLLTVQDFKNINTLAAQRSCMLHIQYNKLKEYINTLTTIEEIELVTFDTEIPEVTEDIVG